MQRAYLQVRLFSYTVTRLERSANTFCSHMQRSSYEMKKRDLTTGVPFVNVQCGETGWYIGFQPHGLWLSAGLANSNNDNRRVQLLIMQSNTFDDDTRR
jgi:hypothetical protein